MTKSNIKTKKEVEAIIPELYKAIALPTHERRIKYLDALLNPVEKGKKKAVWVKCSGQAHNGADYDHCLVCLPFWENYPICPTDKTKLTQSGYCKTCRKHFDIAPSPNEAPKGEAFTMTEICPKCHKPTSTRQTTEAEEMKKMLDPKQTLTVSPLCKDCQPPAPDKEWEDFYIYDSETLIPNWGIVGKRNDITLNQIAKEFGVPIKDYFRSLLLSKDQEADRRVEEVIGEIEKYFEGLIMIPDPQATKLNLIKALKKKLSLSHKEEEK